MGMVMRTMERSGNTMNMVFLDACRDNPLARGVLTGSKGLARMDAPNGSMIVYATVPGSVAADGKGRNSTFTKNLLLHLNTPGLGVGKLLRRVRDSVKKETDGEQVPWEASSMKANFYFADDIVESEMALSARYTDMPEVENNKYLEPGGKAKVLNGFLQKWYDKASEDDKGPDKIATINKKLKYWKNNKEKPPVTIRGEPDYEEIYTEKPRVNLRGSYHLALGEKDAEPILKKYNFFDCYDNENGEFQNDYDLKSINGDNVVIDHATGLMWHQSGSDKYMRLNEVKQWIRSLNNRGYAGHHDWRLPTVEEAASLLESDKRNDRYIDPIFNNKQKWIWTGDKDGSKLAWDVFFDDGQMRLHNIGSNRNYVRPVRSGK